jgi:hypothetical protein
VHPAHVTFDMGLIASLERTLRACEIKNLSVVTNPIWSKTFENEKPSIANVFLFVHKFNMPVHLPNHDTPSNVCNALRLRTDRAQEFESTLQQGANVS